MTSQLPNMSDDVKEKNKAKLAEFGLAGKTQPASKSKLPKETENDVKKAIKDYLAVCGIFNYHLLQALGAYKGSPDRIMHYHGKVIYLEIKKPGGKQSAHQLAFERQCAEDKILYWCVSSVEELQALLVSR